MHGCGTSGRESSESDRVRMSLYSGWIQSNEDRDAYDTSLQFKWQEDG